MKIGHKFTILSWNCAKHHVYVIRIRIPSSEHRVIFWTQRKEKTIYVRFYVKGKCVSFFPSHKTHINCLLISCSSFGRHCRSKMIYNVFWRLSLCLRRINLAEVAVDINMSTNSRSNKHIKLIVFARLNNEVGLNTERDVVELNWTLNKLLLNLNITKIVQISLSIWK